MRRATDESTPPRQESNSRRTLFLSGHLSSDIYALDMYEYSVDRNE